MKFQFLSLSSTRNHFKTKQSIKFPALSSLERQTLGDGSDKNSSGSRPYRLSNSFLSSLVNPVPDSDRQS